MTRILLSVRQPKGRHAAMDRLRTHERDPDELALLVALVAGRIGRPEEGVHLRAVGALAPVFEPKTTTANQSYHLAKVGRSVTLRWLESLKVVLQRFFGDCRTFRRPA